MAINLLLPALFALGSAGANYFANQEAQNARDDALAAERIRQRQFDEEAQGLNAQSRDRYKDYEGQQTERKADLGEMFKDTEAAPPIVPQPKQPTSSNITVQGRNAKSSEDAQARTDQRGEALADFRSFGDLFGSIGREQAQDASQISQIGSFKRGSQAVLPLELEAAMQEGSGLRLLGDVLGLGSAMLTGPALAGSAMPASGGLLGGLFSGGSSAPLSATNVATSVAPAGSTFPGVYGATRLPQIY